jgi:membrane fusion protein, multidrug efflux system
MHSPTEVYPMTPTHSPLFSGLRSILICVLLTSVTGCKEQQPTAAVIRPIKAAVAKPSSGQRITTYSGAIRARIETSLGFRVGGKIIERLVNTGDQVIKDQVIARLDPVDLKLSEQSARANVLAAQTRLTVAHDSLNRAKALYPKGFIAKAAVDQRQLEADAAKSALEAAETQASQAANATEYAELKSDKEGVITAVLAEPGQVAAAGTPIVRLSQSGGVEAAIAVPEQDVARLSVGQSVTVGLWAVPEIKAEGRIREIAGAADPASRTYAVRVMVDSPPAAMRLGMTSVVSIAYSDAQPGVIVPLAALTGREGDMAVFVVDLSAGVVRRRTVSVSGIEADAARIGSGLSGGETVVAAGVQFLGDGQKVRLTGEPTSTASIER